MAEFTGQAKYLEIANDFKRRIRQGELEPGTKLPSETKLMADHEVSRTVARQAISRLREDGYVISHQGKGSFVTRPEEPRQVRRSPEFEEIAGYLADMRREVRRLGERMDKLEQLVRKQPQDG
ncbi:GntR family transcriptional regulator [Streptomyces sp. NPDC047999]|uniref:GntR family transcriptional regulator n=1 Tax=Streptomyces sp. NPDC047999 TaxID=3365497 RepID=UPI003714959C